MDISDLSRASGDQWLTQGPLGTVADPGPLGKYNARTAGRKISTKAKRCYKPL